MNGSEGTGPSTTMVVAPAAAGAHSSSADTGWLECAALISMRPAGRPAASISNGRWPGSPAKRKRAPAAASTAGRSPMGRSRMRCAPSKR